MKDRDNAKRSNDDDSVTLGKYKYKQIRSRARYLNDPLGNKMLERVRIQETQSGGQ